MHQRGRNREVHNRGNKKVEEIKEFRLTRLPDHQGRNVTKRTKGAARVSGTHQIDKS